MDKRQSAKTSNGCCSTRSRRKGGKIVAAGRGAIEPFKAKPKPVPYNIYFIGDPRGAEVTVTEFPSLPGFELE